jgi:TPR repeat protein
MDDDKKLQITTSSRGLTTAPSASLLNRGIASLRKGGEDDAAETLYRQAMARCAGVDFIAMSEINGDWDDRYDWTLDAAFQLLSQAAELGHRDSKFCLGAMHAHRKPLAAITWYLKAADQGHPEAAFQYVKYLYLDAPEQRSSFAPPVSIDKASELLMVAARESHVRAARELGYLLLKQSHESEVGAPDSLRVQAQIWFRRAAELGDPVCAFEYAELLLLSDGACTDYSEAARWYSFAAERGCRQAAIELAYLYERGLGVEKDPTKAASLYWSAGERAHIEGDFTAAIECLKLAADLGCVDAAFLLGELILDETAETTLTAEDEALRYLEQAANAGNSRAAFALGERYAEQGDRAASHAWYRKAAELRHAEAQYRIGKDYYDRGLYSDAAYWFRRAAEEKHVEAAYRLAVMMRWTYEGVELDEEEAARWMIFAADNQHILGCFYAGWMLSNGYGIARDDKRAVKYYRIAAKHGEVLAITNLGWMYANGFGVRQNRKKAFALYMRAARKGEAFAMRNVADCYAKGQGVDIDRGEALIWMLAAAKDKNDSAAQNALGWWYQEGVVVPQNDPQALAWFTRSSAQGNILGSINAGWMFETRHGLEGSDYRPTFYTFDGKIASEPDHLETAAYYYKLSAEKGHPVGQANLALLLERGRGVTKDIDQAIRWYRLAARQMDQRAIDALKRLGVDIHGPVAAEAGRTITRNVEQRVKKALGVVLAKSGDNLLQSE